jgi:hypothetical protein
MAGFTFRIKSIQRASSRAIAQFTATETALEKQNAKLTSVVTEINDQIIALTEAKDSAVARRTENAGIIARIRQIIRG